MKKRVATCSGSQCIEGDAPENKRMLQTIRPSAELETEQDTSDQFQSISRACQSRQSHGANLNAQVRCICLLSLGI